MSCKDKYRVWVKKEKRYRQVVGIDWDKKGNIAEIHTVDPETGHDPWEYTPHEVVLEQYTGVDDERGKEIYDGDLISFVWTEDFNGMDVYYKRPPKQISAVGRVDYSDKYGEWSVRWDDGSIGGYHVSLNEVAVEYVDANGNPLPDRPYHCLVVGNIHENPELNKRSKNGQK